MNKSMYFFLSVLLAGFLLLTSFQDQEVTKEDQEHQIEIAVAENVQLFIQEKTLECETKAHQEATNRAMAKLAEMGKPMPAPRPARPATTTETKPETAAEKEEEKEKEEVRTRTGTTRESGQEGRTRTGTTRIEEEKKEGGEETKPRTRTGTGGGGR